MKMKVTNTTYGMLVANHQAKRTDRIMVQKMNKNGTWGKAFEVTLYGNKTAEDMINNLKELNNAEYRIAE